MNCLYRESTGDLDPNEHQAMDAKNSRTKERTLIDCCSAVW